MKLAERRAILQTMFIGLYFDTEVQLRKASAKSPCEKPHGQVVEGPGIPVDL